MIRNDTRCYYASLVYHTEPKTKKWKAEKLKIKKKTGRLRSIGERSGESVESALAKKAMVGRICRKGRFCAWNEGVEE